MPTGTVQSFSKTEGKGVILADDGNTYPVYRADIEEGYLLVAHGDRVAFSVDYSDGLAKAVEVRRADQEAD